jgi:hypothetical protein
MQEGQEEGQARSVRKAGQEEIRTAREEEHEQGKEIMTASCRTTYAARRAIHCTIALAAVLLSCALGAPRALAAEGPHWDLESRSAPTNLPLAKGGIPGQGLIMVNLANLGDADVNGAGGGEVTLTDTLPTGITVTSVERKISEGAHESETVSDEREARKAAFTCPEATGQHVKCVFVGVLPPYEELKLLIKVAVSAETASEPASNAPEACAQETVLCNQVTVTGGGTEAAEVERPLKIESEPKTSFGVEAYEMTAENEEFKPDVQAGSHPFQLTTDFDLNQTYESEFTGSKAELEPQAPALQKELKFRLPPGLIGNVNAVPECPDVSFGSQGEVGINACEADTAVGVASVTFYENADLHLTTWIVPVFNLVPAPGEPARFGFSVIHVPIVLDTSLRTGEDYGVTISARDISENVQVLSTRVTFWGIAGDKRHDQSRGWSCLGYGNVRYEDSEPCNLGYEAPTGTPPFLTLPTKCESLSAPAQGEAWQPDTPLTGLGGQTKREGEDPRIPNEKPTELTGCGALEFNPSLEVNAETEDASTPTGLLVKVSVPQAKALEASYEGRAEADVSSTRLELPPGIQANPGAANGLTTCSVEQAGFRGEIDQSTDEPDHVDAELEGQTGTALGDELGTQGFTPVAANCPEAAKIGSVDIDSPDLKEDLTGGVYLAYQDTNPFGSPLALYLIAEEPTSKTLVKLAGEVTINQETGQLISTFQNAPQAPFESLTLHLWNGARSSQATPAECGKYPAVGTFTSSSDEAEPEAPSAPVESRSTIEITSGPGGSPCPEGALPFTPSVQAGPTNTQAAADTPFTLNIGRPDGDQAIESVTMKLPPGAAALISQVTPCSEAQAEADACPASSEVGHTTSVSGLGGSPVTLNGSLYLTGPLTANANHGSGPFGLLAKTLAHAGPFELGYVNVFSTININPETAAATVTSGRIPDMLKGVPVQLKALSVTVERPEGKPFEFNPTNCGEELKIEGSLDAYEGGSTPISANYPLTGCSSLAFEPKLTASVLGKGSKANGTTFAVKIESSGLGQANIRKVDLTIPEALPSRLTTIQKACPEATFNANPAGCDEGSVIGEGIVHTPVFNNELRGPAYLVSHGGAAFPDVEFVLQGEGIKLILDGKTDIKNGITYSKFETAPDAPFTSFETILPAGPHSALTTDVPENEDFSLCKQASSRLEMPTTIVAQNGKPIEQTTKIALTGCGGVLPYKAKKLTRAQKLAKALKACRTKYKSKSKKSKRLACEKQARKKYGPLPKKKSSKKKK